MRSLKARTLGGAVAILSIIAASPSRAQLQAQVLAPSPAPAPEPTPSLFSRDRDVPVAERSFAGFAPVGLPIGELRLFPQLGVSAIGTSNVFENDERNHGDFLGELTPGLDLQFDNSQLLMDAYVNAEIDRFAQFHSENENQATVGINVSRALPGYSSVFAGGSFGYVALPRISPESPVNAGAPLRYTDTQADVGGAYEQNRVRVTGRFDLESLQFDPGVLIGGGELSTGDHDRARYTGTGQIAYALSPATDIYFGGAYNVLNYKLSPPNVALQRDSHGYEAFVGTSFEVTGLTRADIRVGYLDQDFDAHALGRIEGVGVRGQLEYFPSRLTTVTVQVRRSVEDSGVPNSGGFLESGGSIAVDHELRRYIMLNTKASYFDDQYQGIGRRDGILFFTAGGTYLSHHGWNLKLAYEYYHQNSRGCDCSVNYDDHRAVATLTFKY